MCLTIGHHVRPNSGVTNHRNGGNMVSGVGPVRSVPCSRGNAPMSVMLGPLNMPSHVGVNRVLRARLNVTTGNVNSGVGTVLGRRRRITGLHRFVRHTCSLNTSIHRGISLDAFDSRRIVHLTRGLHGNVPVTAPIFSNTGRTRVGRLLGLNSLPASNRVHLCSNHANRRFRHPMAINCVCVLGLGRLISSGVRTHSANSCDLIARRPLNNGTRFNNRHFKRVRI